MSIVSRILAIVILGAVALCLIAFPMAMSITFAETKDPLPTFAPFLAVAVLTIFIVLWAPTARIAWGRLFVLNGLAAFALPLQGILYSALEKLATLARTPADLHLGATLGVGLFGTAITGALALVGFFMGVIFIVAGYFVLRGAPRYR